MSFIGFVVLVAVAAALNRAMAWSKRALARHRARFEAAGLEENNKPWRIRQEGYKRVFLIAFVVSGLLIQIGFAHQFRHREGALILVAAVLAWVPAWAVWLAVRTVAEWVHPEGEVAVAMLLNQFHPKEENPGDVAALGSAKLVSPASIGLTNPFGRFATRPQPIISSGKVAK